MDSLPEDFFVTEMQFTPRVYRDVYPSIDPTSSELSMAGKVAIVTGASQGIGGRGIAPAFAKAGAKAVVLVARDQEKLDQIAAELKALSPKTQVLAVSVELTNEENIKALFQKINTEFGHADILVNNAGVMRGYGNISEVDTDMWWKDIEINGRGTFLMTHYFLKSLPSDVHGHLVNVTSGMAYGIYPGNSAYSFGKLINLQTAAYVAAENPNVTAVALHPGLVLAGTTAPPFKRFALDTPGLVGGVAVWLCTEKAGFMNGKYMNVNWSVDDMYERKEEIKGGKLLQIDLTGTFGASQFTK